MKTHATSHSLRPTWLLVNLLTINFFLAFGFSTNAQPGLVAHYAFNGTFTDQTSNDNHALPTGNPTFVADRLGVPNRAIGLGGCGNPQFLRVPNAPSLQVTNTLTVAFWAKVDLSSGMDPGTGTCNEMGRQVFFAKGGDGYGGSPPGIQGLTFQQNGQQQISFESSTNSGQASVTASRPLPGDAWHHYTYLITASELRMYVDAQLIHTRPVSLNFLEANQQDLYLGVMGPKSSPVLGITNWYPLHGALDDVRVFNRALTPQEIATVFASDDAGSCIPTLSVLPTENQTICEGQSVTLKGVPSTDVQLQWLKNGQPIAQGTLDSLVVSQSGSYQLEATRRTDTWKHDMPGLDKTLNDVQYVGNTGWIVGDYGTLLKTTNGGTAWDTIPIFRDTHFYAVNFIDTQVGWIGGSSGLLLKTTNGGTNWQQQHIPTTGNVSKIQFLDQNAGYALSEGLLFKTTDGGNSWTSVATPTTKALVDITFVDIDFGWITSNDQIFKTSNGGTSWVLQKGPLPSPCFQSTFKKIFALNRDLCWVTYLSEYCGSKSVSRTLDGGTTWTDYAIYIPAAAFAELSYLNPTDLVFTDAQTGYIVSTFYSRTNASSGVSGGAVFHTQDGGQTWSSIYTNYQHAQPIAISQANSSKGTVVGVGGLFLEVTNSDTVVSPYLNRTFLPLTSVGGTSRKVFVAGGIPRRLEQGTHPDSKAVILTQEDEQSWVKSETGFAINAGGYPYNDGYTIRQIKFKNQQLGWKAGLGSLYSTTDGGTTWKSLFPTNQPPPTYLLIEKAYFKTDTTGLFISRDPSIGVGEASLYRFSGTSRSSVSINFKDPGEPPSIGFLDLQFIDDNTGFITTSNGKLIKTTDGGTSWSVHLVRANTALNRCYFVSAQIGWVVDENGLIMKTTDGGQSWITQNSGSTATWNGIYFLSAQEGYVVGSGGTLVKTSDGGNSWVSIVTNTHNALNDIAFTTRDRGYIVGDYGTILAFDPTLLPECKATSAAVNVSISSGTLCETASSGAWNILSTWSCGHIPLICDQVAINPGHVVTLSQSVQVRGIEVRQNGQLSMQGGNVLVQQ